MAIIDDSTTTKDLERSRCCFGCCNILSAGKAVAIFLFVSAAVNLYLLWMRGPDDFSGSLICICTMKAVGTAIWGIGKRKTWPCVFMIVLLAILTLACFIVAVRMLVSISFGDCSSTFGDASPDDITACTVVRSIAIACLIVSAAFNVWFIFIFAQVRAYIVALNTDTSTTTGIAPPPTYDSIFAITGGKNKELIA